MKFNAIAFDSQESGPNIIITISFDLVDDSVVPNVIKAKTSVNFNVPNTLTLALLKSTIASVSLRLLQDWYNDWKITQSRLNDLYTAKEVALENYINSNITF